VTDRNDGETLASSRPLFETPRFVAHDLGAADMPLVQGMFDANPEYFLCVNGRLPHADEAQLEFAELPPPHLSFTRKWFVGLFDRAGALQGVAVVLSDLSAPTVWHVALFLVATGLHGSGAASLMYDGLEAWMRQGGARWLRLGVVQGNARAERFWQRCGYREVRLREGVDTGGRVNTIRVLVKPLATSPVDDYFALVPRDRPGSPLA
jgi:GNAT superfamily N-acetyltransferase